VAAILSKIYDNEILSGDAAGLRFIQDWGGKSRASIYNIQHSKGKSKKRIENMIKESGHQATKGI